MKQFREGHVCKAHRLLHHSTLILREKKTRKRRRRRRRREPASALARRPPPERPHPSTLNPQPSTLNLQTPVEICGVGLRGGEPASALARRPPPERRPPPAQPCGRVLPISRENTRIWSLFLLSAAELGGVLSGEDLASSTRHRSIRARSRATGSAIGLVFGG